jgi:periplasmic protein TonB
VNHSRDRVFRYALIASLALHALLFVAFPDLIDTARRAASIPPQIIARLMQPEPAPPAPAVPVEEVRREAPPPKKAAKPASAEKPPVLQPAPVLSSPQPAPAPEQTTAAPAVPPSPPVAAIEPQSASPPQAAPQQQAGPPPDVLSRDQYRVQLIDEARRHKRYPALARENNWQGNVLVGVSVGPNGRASVTLKGSSGYEVLDRQALDMFRQAARAVPVPPPLRGKEFVLEVRAVYGLED